MHRAVIDEEMSFIKFFYIVVKNKKIDILMRNRKKPQLSVRVDWPSFMTISNYDRKCMPSVVELIVH